MDNVQFYLRKSLGFESVCRLFIKHSASNKQLIFRNASVSKRKIRVAPTSRAVAAENVQLEANKYEEVGITEFIGPRPRIMAAIKQKNRDFQVHEIDEVGQRVQLTDFSVPRGNRNKAFKPFINCHLYKDGLEHAQVLELITKSFRTNIQVRVAGRKDKFGQTTQKISIMIPENAKINENSRKLSGTKCRLGNFSYSSDPVALGKCQGNHFKILLRNVQSAFYSDDHSIDNPSMSSMDVAAVIQESMDNLREVGYINYFGLQRFGFNSHKVGSQLLQQNWEKAFDLLLAIRPDDRTSTSIAKKVWLNSRGAAELLRISQKGIKHNPGNIFETVGRYHYQDGLSLKETFGKIPRYIRSLYLISFMSYLWNKVASFRVQKFGLKVIPGDEVYTNVKSSSQVLFSDQEDSDIEDEDIKSNIPVRILTQEDLKEGHPYSIYDVVLPSLGLNITKYSNPVIQDYCKKLLADEGLTLDIFSTLQVADAPGINLGCYRNLITKPRDVSYQIISYAESDSLKELMPSDLELLGIHEELKCKVSGQGSAKFQQNAQLKDKIGIIVEFSLPPGAFATMVLRSIVQTSNFDSYNSNAVK